MYAVPAPESGADTQEREKQMKRLIAIVLLFVLAAINIGCSDMAEGQRQRAGDAQKEMSHDTGRQ